MRRIGRRTIIFIFTLIGLLGISLSQNAAALTISGLGLPSEHPDLLGGAVIDFDANPAGTYATTFDYADVSMTGNNVLGIINFDGSFNVTGNALALTTNYRTQELTFNFLSTVAAFGFNFGGTEREWRLQAYSVAGSLLDELTIPIFNDSNDGEWFGISAPGIASAKLFNTAFDVGSDTGSLDYVVLDNLTYVSAVPEPSTFVLITLGLAGLALGHRQQRNNRA